MIIINIEQTIEYLKSFESYNFQILIILSFFFLTGLITYLSNRILIKEKRKSDESLTDRVKRIYLPYDLTISKLIFYNLGILSIAYLLANFLNFSTTINIFLGIFLIESAAIAYGIYKKPNSINTDNDMPDFLSDMAKVYAVYPDTLNAFSEATKFIKTPELKSLFEEIANNAKYSSLTEALKKYSIERNIEYLKYLANTFELQQEMGGDLSNMLNKMSRSLSRQQIATKEINTILLQNTISGIIASAMFPIMLIGMIIFAPSYVETLYTDSTGRLILILCIFWWLLGTAFTLKVTKFNS